MALAIHEGGPQDGLKVKTTSAPHTRYYAPAEERKRRGWLTLSRYVFVPPRDGAKCRYRFTGTEQVQGPVPGDETAPDWS